MDVFTGISRNTTSTRFFQTLFNNLVIFPREPDQELNHGLGKFWSLTLFDEIPEFLTNFGFVARRWFVARSCVQFFCHGNLPCVDGYLNKRVACCVVFYYFCCLVLLVLLAPVVFCVYGYLDMLISIITALPPFSCFAFLIRIITAQRCQHCFVWKSWSALRGKILLPLAMASESLESKTFDRQLEKPICLSWTGLMSGAQFALLSFSRLECLKLPACFSCSTHY